MYQFKAKKETFRSNEELTLDFTDTEFRAIYRYGREGILFLFDLIRMNSKKVTKIVMGCGILHNICIQLNEPDVVAEELVNEDVENGNKYNGQQDGRGIRKHIAETYFNLDDKLCNNDDGARFDALNKFVKSKLQTGSEKFIIPEMSILDVNMYLKKLDKSKATGLDDVGPNILSMCSDVIAPALTYIFNLSIKSGKFPSIFKTARSLTCNLIKNGDHISGDGFYVKLDNDEVDVDCLGCVRCYTSTMHCACRRIYKHMAIGAIVATGVLCGIGALLCIGGLVFACKKCVSDGVIV
ncbi:unnamed protein product [Mytilus edulis]|uniref:Uncharacterized protein n=1 Tax=Mytilus edulis TaxID=6550 RepID=A0A8S3U997_MYTED|nr:unnamed protein product [Mytilus edulis]